ncbi:helix-turn-helix transcriptional regulator [Geodermatophilus sp. SYSU D00691]
MTTETAPPVPAPRRSHFAMSDPLEVRDFLDQAFGGRLRLDGLGDGEPLVTVDRVDTGAFSVTDVRMAADLVFQVSGQDELLINMVLAGRLGQDSGKVTDRYRSGDVCIGNHPHAHLVARSHDLRMHTVVLPAGVLTEVAGGASGPAGRSWELLSRRPTAGGTARWWATSRFVDDLLVEPAAVTAPLLVGPAARLLAATVLTIFPNTLAPPPVARDRVDAHPGTLRRAVAYIEANPDLDLSVADIARAACVTPRAVQLAFRRHLNTTPTAYLRQVRLAQAHRQLRDATPGDGLTVTAVAARWGFTPSRFTERYRAAYGVLPSRTLRT